MYILIITFYLSLIGITSMILIKRNELKKNTSSPSSPTVVSIEQTLSKTFTQIRRSGRFFNKHTIIVLIQFLTFHILFRIRKIYVELKHRVLQNPHGKKMLDAVRGRGEIKNHGASFYLRRISDR